MSVGEIKCYLFCCIFKEKATCEIGHGSKEQLSGNSVANMICCSVRSLSTFTFDILATKKIALSRMPINTPIDRLCVTTTAMTVTTMTVESDKGTRVRLRSEDQSNVPIETMIMTPTSAGIGILYYPVS